MRGRSLPGGGIEVQKNSHNDIFVGKKIRYRRRMLGMSQRTLADYLGISFQQIQKYEKGLNRVGAGRLKDIADIFGVPIAFFYPKTATKEGTSCHHDEIISSKEEYLLLKSFRVLTSVKQKAILDLISDQK
ncbi:helix-turn-helix domain-containing protein [Bartonella sp. WD16.2]|uniref:helix-turn-helix domain-containing protein n=1 Tax=Bartonella sp. WD16.2 TaxID=1933904 RepID=UPI00099A6FF7|nr:helix-turn-helix transcriptional regulator [Bartonella sp. WD16.2]